MDNEIKLDSKVLRSWLKKHSTFTFILGFACAFGFVYFLNSVLQVSESISTVIAWVSFFALMIWIENGIAGLKKNLNLTIKATKWLLIISIIFFIFCIFAGWLAALPPTSIIILLLILILFK